METHAVPSMASVFQAADATRCTGFGCKTCHGPGFRTPRHYLPKLAMKDGKLTAFAEKPEIAKFMVQSVAPKRAEAMALPPFDMQIGKSFGCAGCHTIEVQ